MKQTWPKTFCYLLLVSLLACVLSIPKPTLAAPKKLIPIKFKCDWHRSVQFLGFYVAEEKGYYRDVGLDVNIDSASHSSRKENW